ncbi:MAG: hypothetical protein ACXW3O_15745 [Brevundimonas sp.]
MFGRFPRRNNRKRRLANWFAHERDGDMHAFDVHGLAAGVRVLAAAVLRDVGRRWAARPRGSA